MTHHDTTGQDNHTVTLLQPPSASICLPANPGFVSSKFTEDPSVTKVARPEVDSKYSLWKMRNQIVDIQTSHQIWHHVITYIILECYFMKAKNN